MNTLELFNVVPAKSGGDYVVLSEYGVIIEPSASWAKHEIVKFLREKKAYQIRNGKSFAKERKLRVSSQMTAIDKISFLLAFSKNTVSASKGHSDVLRKALVDRWKNCFYVNDVLEYCGATLVSDSTEADIDLSPNKLKRDSFMTLFIER